MFETVLMIIIACGHGEGGCHISLQNTDRVICERAQQQVAANKKMNWYASVECVSTRIN